MWRHCEPSVRPHLARQGAGFVAQGNSASWNRLYTRQPVMYSTLGPQLCHMDQWVMLGYCGSPVRLESAMDSRPVHPPAGSRFGFSDRPSALTGLNFGSPPIPLLSCRQWMHFRSSFLSRILELKHVSLKWLDVGKKRTRGREALPEHLHSGIG